MSASSGPAPWLSSQLAVAARCASTRHVRPSNSRRHNAVSTPAASRYPVAWSSACTGKTLGVTAVGRLGPRDPRGGLHDAVETTPVRPGSRRSPRGQRRVDDRGVARGDRLRVEPVLSQRSRPVTGDEDVGVGEQVVQASQVGGPTQVQQGGALAGARVHMHLGDLGQVRVVDAQHVAPEVGQAFGWPPAPRSPGSGRAPWGVPGTAGGPDRPPGRSPAADPRRPDPPPTQSIRPADEPAPRRLRRR